MSELTHQTPVRLDMAALEHAAATAALAIDGVVGPRNGLGRLLQLGGYPKVRAQLTRSGRLRIDMRLVARYGVNIRDSFAKAVQQAVVTKIQQMTDAPIECVNIVINRMQVDVDSLNQTYKEKAT